jgi:hypothetical protein
MESRIRLWIGVLALFAAGAAAAVPFEELLYKGRASYFYGDAKSDAHQKLQDNLRRGAFAERMAQIAGVVRLKQNLAVGFASCGRANAFFEPQRSTIVICYEMLELLVNLARADTDGIMRMERAAVSRFIDGAIWGMYFHELGHAIMRINAVPFTGREEDVADQFALYFATGFIEPRGGVVIAPTVWFFEQLSKQRELSSIDQGSIKALLANEHSLDRQRVFNLACWALGSSTASGAQVAQIVGLPDNRARRCSGEYTALDRAFRKQFQRYLKVRAQ